MKTYRECVIEVLTKHGLLEYFDVEASSLPDNLWYYLVDDVSEVSGYSNNFWWNIYDEVEGVYGDGHISLTTKLHVYKEMLQVFEANTPYKSRFGFCNRLAITTRILGIGRFYEVCNFSELYAQKPKDYFYTYWWRLVDGVDENRCNALREAIKLVEAKIEASKTL